MKIPKVKLITQPETEEAKKAVGYEWNDVAGTRHFDSSPINDDVECLGLHNGIWEVYYIERGQKSKPSFTTTDKGIAIKYYHDYILEKEHWHLIAYKEGTTQKGKSFLVSKHSHNQIRIYGKDNYYSFQIAIKRKGEKRFDFKDVISTKNKSLEQVKELGFIVLKGLTTEDNKEKEF